MTVSVLIFGMMAHWLACFWYLIGVSELNSAYGIRTGVGWLYELSRSLNVSYQAENHTDISPSNLTISKVMMKLGPEMSSRYITSLYFTLSSLTSVGFGNVSANTDMEKIFSVLIMLIGALMHAVVFGNVTAIISVNYIRFDLFFFYDLIENLCAKISRV